MGCVMMMPALASRVIFDNRNAVISIRKTDTVTLTSDRMPLLGEAANATGSVVLQTLNLISSNKLTSVMRHTVSLVIIKGK